MPPPDSRTPSEKSDAKTRTAAAATARGSRYIEYSNNTQSQESASETALF